MAFDYQAFQRDIELLIDESLSEDGQRRIFVMFAREEVEKFEAMWAQALAKRPEIERFVDGVRDAPLESVTIPGGTVLARVRPNGPVAARAIRLIEIFTKVRTGGFKRSNAIFINDVRVGQGREPEPGDQTAITFLAPFARKAEVRRFNDRDDSGFRDGLIKGVTKILKSEFTGAPVKIRDTFRDFLGERFPTILIG